MIIRTALAAALLASATGAVAQVGVRSSTASPQTRPDSDDAIIVQGQKKKEVVQALRQLIQPSKHEQLARFEDNICPMVIGMPREWTGKLTAMVRANITAVGGKLEPAGCKPNALAIFIDQPRELVAALHDDAPFFFNMTPREYDKFAAQPGPVWSWHVTDMRGRDGEQLASGSMMNGAGEFAIVKNAAASRLYTNIREDMLAGFVVIDRQKTIGTTLRQLADLVTMHMLLDVRHDSGARDMTSILSLFEARPDGLVAPARFSRFDKGALTGFYTQRENNRTATQQRENIAKAIRTGAGDEKAGSDK